MIDHVSLRVRDLAASKAFYTAVLAPLGYKVAMEFPDGAGLCADGKFDLWLIQDPQATPQHLAFAAPDRSAVDAFHAAALSAGGRDNGPPGLRPQYHADYYAAFIFDPSGHNMEAVHHRPTVTGAKAAGKRVTRGAKGSARKVAKASKGRARRSPGKAKGGRGRKPAARRIVKGPKG